VPSLPKEKGDLEVQDELLAVACLTLSNKENDHHELKIF